MNEVSNEQPNDAPQDLRKARISKTQNCRRKEAVKITAILSEMETKRPIRKRINETRVDFS
jgi:hypothetical protein